jgi:hypothetical protein
VCPDSAKKQTPEYKLSRVKTTFASLCLMFVYVKYVDRWQCIKISTALPPPPTQPNFYPFIWGLLAVFHGFHPPQTPSRKLGLEWWLIGFADFLRYNYFPIFWWIFMQTIRRLLNLYTVNSQLINLNSFCLFFIHLNLIKGIFQVFKNFALSIF